MDPNFPHSFACDVRVELGEWYLRVEMTVHNKNEVGGDNLTWTGALHTYFRVEDVSTVRISTLKGVGQVGNETGWHAPVIDERDETTVHERETDRCYLNAPDTVTVTSSSGRLTVAKEAFPDTVVWNIHSEGAKAMSDLGDDEWKNYVRIEAAACISPISVEPGAFWTGAQVMTVDH